MFEPERPAPLPQDPPHAEHDDEDDDEGEEDAPPQMSTDEAARATRLEYALHEEQAAAYAKAAGYEHVQHATGHLIRLQRETLKTAEMVDVGARRNAETAALLGQTQAKMAEGQLKLADTMLSGMGRLAAKLEQPAVPRISGGEIAGRVVEKIIDKVGDVAASVFGGKGPELLQALQQMGLGGPSPPGAAPSGQAPSGDPGPSGAPSPAGAAAQPPSPEESLQVLQSLSVLMDHIPPDMDRMSLAELRAYLAQVRGGRR
jgi:hypothetical protein